MHTIVEWAQGVPIVVYLDQLIHAYSYVGMVKKIENAWKLSKTFFFHHVHKRLMLGSCSNVNFEVNMLLCDAKIPICITIKIKIDS